MQESHRTFGNHRRFAKPVPQDGITVGYVRVSSQDQKECLATQSEALKEKARLQDIEIDETISDIGSGMNYKKKGFKKLLTRLLSQKVKRLVIMQKDRLLRFGSEILFSICQFFNIEVVILEPTPNSTPTEQLCMDLVEIMTVFTNKIYGMRSHSNKKVLQPSK